MANSDIDCSESGVISRRSSAIERRQVAAIVGTLLAVPAAWLAGCASLPGPPLFAIVAALAAVIPVIACLGYAMTPPRPVKSVVVAFTCTFLIVLVLSSMARRDACGIHGLKRGIELRALVQLGAHEFKRTGEVPASFAVLAARNKYFEPWFARLCGCESPADVRVGRYSLEEVMHGGVPESELMAESLKSRICEIESLGRIRIWHNQKAWKAGAIVAWRDQDGCGGYDVANISMSTSETDSVMQPNDDYFAPALQRAEVLGIQYPLELLELIRTGPK